MKKLLTSMLNRLITDLTSLASFLYLGIRIPAEIMRILADRIHKSAPECICQILQVLALPFTALSISCRKLCRFTSDSLPLLWDHFLNIPRRVVSSLDQVHSQKTEKRNAKKYWRIYRSCVKQMLMLKNPLLRRFIGPKIVLLIMVCLQAISWFTTHSGSRFYMGGINEIAPLCFTTAIQLGMLYYAYTVFENGRLHLGKLLGLVVCTFISAAFSFSGLAGNMLPLEQEYRAEYQDYALTFNQVREDAQKNGMLPDAVMAIVQDFYAGTEGLLKQAEITKQANATKIAANNHMNSSNGTVKTETRDPNSGVRTKTTSTTVTSEYAAGQSENTLLTQENAAIDGYVQALENALYSDPASKALRFTPEDLKNYLTADEAARYSDPAMKAIRSGMGSINQALSAFTAVQSIVIPPGLAPLDLDSMAELIHETDQVMAVSLRPFEDFVPQSVPNTLVPSTARPLIQLLADQSSTQKLEDIRNAMQIEAREKTTELVNIGQNLLPPQSISALNEKKADILNLDAPSTAVFIRLFDPRYRNILAAALILAGLVDGLTLFISLTGEHSSHSVLKAATNRDYINDQDELFAIVFESLQGSMENELINSAFLEEMRFEKFRRTCNRYLNNIIHIIQDFLKCFHVSQWTMANGFGLYAEASDFAGEREELFTPIITILCELGYMKILSRNDFNLIKSEFNREATEVKYTAASDSADEESYIYLLRFKAENYLRKNLADSITALPFGDGVIPLASRHADADDTQKANHA